MILLDVSYMRGSPLQYSSTISPSPVQPTASYLHEQQQPFDQFAYLNRFDLYKKSRDMAHELIMPQSPTSSQSDSENSVSSIEISPKQIRPTIIIKNNTEVECRWRNCGLRFESLDLLASHVTKVHASSGPGGLFYCGWEGCTRNNRGFNARYKMLVHVRTHTNEKPHRCDQCDKSFSRAENLKIHTRSHSGEKPYVCPVPGCLKAYSNSSDRFKHTRTHQIEKPYQCKIPGCPKRYTDPSSLRKHVKTFKHFVTTGEEYVLEQNHQRTIDSPTTLSIAPNNKYYRVQDTVKDEVVPKKICACNCPHNCCSSATTDLLGLRHQGQWNRLFLHEQRNYTYHHHQNSTISPNSDLIDVESMDIDTPLDLTVTKKTIYN